MVSVKREVATGVNVSVPLRWWPPGGEPSRRAETIHPFGIRQDDDIGRGARLNLARHRPAGAERQTHCDTLVPLIVRGDLGQGVGERGGGEDRHRPVLPWRSRRASREGDKDQARQRLRQRFRVDQKNVDVLRRRPVIVAGT